MVDATNVPVVDCERCDGLGATVKPCSCLEQQGQSFMGWLRTHMAPSSQVCRQCHGAKTISVECHQCDAGGKKRAQLVLIMINIDTGAVASRQVVPGSVEPTRYRDTINWCLGLQPLIDELATQTDAAWFDDRMSTSDLILPRDFNPDLPADQQRAMQAQVLGNRGMRRHVYIARSHPPQQAPSPDDTLAKWCRIAGQLCMDLVVRRAGHVIQPGNTSWGWNVALAHAGQPLPAGDAFLGFRDDLAAAIADTDLTRMLSSVSTAYQRAENTATPAHFLSPPDSAGDAIDTEDVGTVAQLAARLDDLRESPAGAVAIWRNNSWHTSTVTAAGTRIQEIPSPTGMKTPKKLTTWSLDTPPSPPPYWTQPIASTPCTNCADRQAWTTCDCVAILETPDPQCERCGGDGTRNVDNCTRCGDARRLYSGAVFTITDLSGYARHINLTPDANADITRIADHPNSTNAGEYQLPDTYRLTGYLFDDGIDLADVHEPLGGHVSYNYMGGTIFAPNDATALDVTTRYCRDVAKFNIAARNFIIVKRPRSEKLSTLTNIGLGLGFDVVAACRFRSLDKANGVHASTGTRWGITLLTPGTTIDYPNSATGPHRYLASAVGDYIDHIATWYTTHRSLTATAVDTAPQRPATTSTDANRLEPVLSQLAQQHDFDTITARITPHHTTITQHLFGSARKSMPEPDLILAQAPTIAEVIAHFER